VVGLEPGEWFVEAFDGVFDDVSAGDHGDEWLGVMSGSG
jgi:hypothetical protein